MKYTRKALFLIAAIMLIIMILPGCNTIPEEYTDGVKLDRDYPDDDMPLMDDAIVYESDEDDDEITIRYGTKEDLDDVADFYKDHFDDNDIALDDETDNNTRYAAEGAYKDFIFELRATSPSGEYEKKVFETVVKIEIAFVEETTETTAATPAPEMTLEVQLPGFWRQESFDDGTGKQYTAEHGIAYEFTEGGALSAYANFTLLGTGTWSVSDLGSIELTAIDGSKSEATAVIEQRDGKDYLIWKDITGTLVFYRSSMAEFTADVPAQLSPDEQLAAALADITWYYVHYSDENGEIQATKSGSLIYYSDGTLEDTFDGNTQTGTWRVENGRLYCDYDDGSSVNWVVEVKSEGGVQYLYYYSNSDPGAYWLYADQPGNGAVTPTESATYTSDADIIRMIAGVTWNIRYYLYADGSTEDTGSGTINYHSDGTFNEVWDGGLYDGMWHVLDGTLYMNYSDGDRIVHETHIEYDAESDSMDLFLGDTEEGYEGCYWVFTTYEL